MAKKCVRTLCYEAQDKTIERFSRISEAGRTFLPDDPGSYIRCVMDEDWFKSAYPGLTGKPVEVRRGRGQGRSWTSTPPERIISICAGHREAAAECEWACLHELAHLVTPKDQPVNGHGHNWRVAYVLLVRRMLGVRPSLELREQFRRREVPMWDRRSIPPMAVKA
jgi:putative metallohydrolase (TIGR04338 family)